MPKIAPGVCYSNLRALKSNTASQLSVEYVFPSCSRVIPLASAEISNCFKNRRMPLSFIEGHSPLNCGFILSLSVRLREVRRALRSPPSRTAGFQPRGVLCCPRDMPRTDTGSASRAICFCSSSRSAPCRYPLFRRAVFRAGRRAGIVPGGAARGG